MGACVAIFVNLNAGLSIVWGAITSFLVLILVGIVLEVLVFSRLEGRGPVAPIVASVGVGLIIQNGINAVASTDQWLYSIPVVGDVPIVPGLGINWIRDVTTFAVGFSFMASVHVLLKYTNLGKAMRATADNLELAKATGIDTKRVTYAAWAISCGFASTSGVLLGLIGVVSPQMGIQYLLLVFAAVIVGGIGSAYGAMLGGLVVGLSQEMVVPLLVWLGEPDVIGLPHADAYKVAVPFMILIAVLLFRPSGIAGRQTAIVPRGVVIVPGHLGGFSLPFAFGAIMAMVVSGLAAVLIAIPTLRLRADYLAIATLAFSEIIRRITTNLDTVTGGTNGITKIPRLITFDPPNPFANAMVVLGAGAALVLAAFLVLSFIEESPWGRVLRAVREDEVATMALGKNTLLFKIEAFGIGGALMGLAGALFTLTIPYLEPSNL